MKEKSRALIDANFNKSSLTSTILLLIKSVQGPKLKLKAFFLVKFF